MTLRQSAAFTALCALGICVAILVGGCVCQPGGKIINYWGWRSVQCESGTNIHFQVDGGARADVKVSPAP
jgi:hypothetical protein